MLTDAQREEFESRGVVRVPGAVDVAGMRDRLVEFAVTQLGFDRDSPATWPVILPRMVKPLKKANAFGEMLSPTVQGVIDEVMGDTPVWRPPWAAPQLLMTPPCGGVWTLPHKVWHLDFRAPGWLEGMAGVQSFVFLDRVEPRSAGTLAATGTHRLIDALRVEQGPAWAGRSRDVRRALRTSNPWLRALWSNSGHEDRIERFMHETTEVDGIPLQVVEMTGEPGDAIFMHPWIFHAPALNCGTRPRLMLTYRTHARGPDGKTLEE